MHLRYDYDVFILNSKEQIVFKDQDLIISSTQPNVYIPIYISQFATAFQRQYQDRCDILYICSDTLRVASTYSNAAYVYVKNEDQLYYVIDYKAEEIGSKNEKIYVQHCGKLAFSDLKAFSLQGKSKEEIRVLVKTSGVTLHLNSDKKSADFFHKKLFYFRGEDAYQKGTCFFKNKEYQIAANYFFLSYKFFLYAYQHWKLIFAGSRKALKQVLESIKTAIEMAKNAIEKSLKELGPHCTPIYTYLLLQKEIRQEPVLEIPQVELAEKEYIEKGTYGVVYRGIWTNNGKNIDVAIKHIDKVDKKWIDNEISIMGQFSSHPNIVNLYGVTCKKKNYPDVLIMELLDKTLKDYLTDNQNINFNIYLSLIMDITAGIKVLHEKKIFHGDLKNSNILLKILSNPPYVQAKIGDFGGAKLKGNPFECSFAVRSYNDTENIFTPSYAAPEVLSRGNQFREGRGSDIYSFSVIVSKMSYQKKQEKLPDATRSSCFKEGPSLPNLEGKMTVAEISPDAERHFKKLMSNCWEENPKKRPAITEIQSGLIEKMSLWKKPQAALPNSVNNNSMKKLN